jgi:hypothetical protein
MRPSRMTARASVLQERTAAGCKRCGWLIGFWGPSVGRGHFEKGRPATLAERRSGRSFNIKEKFC